MSPARWSTGVATRLNGFSVGGLVYGAIVTAAVLVTAGGHDVSTRRLVVSWAIVLVVYWLTHVYVHAAETLLAGDERGLLRRSQSAARGELGVLAGGVPGIVVFVVAASAGSDTVAAEKVALYFTVVLLAVVGYAGARHAGRSAAGSWGEALGAALLGLLMVAAKTALH